MLLGRVIEVILRECQLGVSCTMLMSSKFASHNLKSNVTPSLTLFSPQQLLSSLLSLSVDCLSLINTISMRA